MEGYIIIFLVALALVVFVNIVFLLRLYDKCKKLESKNAENSQEITVGNLLYFEIFYMLSIVPSKKQISFEKRKHSMETWNAVEDNIKNYGQIIMEEKGDKYIFRLKNN